jgi:Cu/Ag efflux protein CusF
MVASIAHLWSGDQTPNLRPAKKAEIILRCPCTTHLKQEHPVDAHAEQVLGSKAELETAAIPPPPSPSCRPWALLRRNQFGRYGLSRIFQNQETAMTIARIILAATAGLAIISSAAMAQQALTGTVTTVDRISRTVAIRPTQDGTVGANTGSAAEEFKAQDGLSLENLHAGDKVTFTTSEAGVIKTITKF